MAEHGGQRNALYAWLSLSSRLSLLFLDVRRARRVNQRQEPGVVSISRVVFVLVSEKG